MGAEARAKELGIEFTDDLAVIRSFIRGGSGLGAVCWTRLREQTARLRPVSGKEEGAAEKIRNSARNT